jgi:hypothetical protein
MIDPPTYGAAALALVAGMVGGGWGHGRISRFDPRPYPAFEMPRDDAARMAAAEAKRERRRQRNLGRHPLLSPAVRGFLARELAEAAGVPVGGAR